MKKIIYFLTFFFILLVCAYSQDFRNAYWGSSSSFVLNKEGEDYIEKNSDCYLYVRELNDTLNPLIYSFYREKLISATWMTPLCEYDLHLKYFLKNYGRQDYNTGKKYVWVKEDKTVISINIVENKVMIIYASVFLFSKQACEIQEKESR